MSENVEEKKPIYKKWWFWVIIVVLVIGSALNLIENNTQQTSNDSNIVENKNYEYVSYTLKNNSTEKIEKIVTDENITSEEMKKIYNEEKENNTNFKTYTIWFFSDKDTALKANNYELGYATSKNGETIVENVKEIKQEEEEKKIEEEAKKNAEKAEEEAKKKAEQEEKEFKESCKKYSFKELARNPDKIKGEKVKLIGEVIQVMNGDFVKAYRVNITKNEYDFYEDTIYLTYVPKTENEDNILEDDIITIWGTALGDYTYTSVIGASVTVPHVDAEYIEIN